MFPSLVQLCILSGNVRRDVAGNEQLLGELFDMFEATHRFKEVKRLIWSDSGVKNNISEPNKFRAAYSDGMIKVLYDRFHRAQSHAYGINNLLSRKGYEVYAQARNELSRFVYKESKKSNLEVILQCVDAVQLVNDLLSQVDVSGSDDYDSLIDLQCAIAELSGESCFHVYESSDEELSESD